MGSLIKVKLSKLSIIFIVFLISIIYTAYRVVPPFIYNSYESDFRDEIGSSLDLSQTIDSAIQIRRTGLADGSISRQEHLELGQQIVASIKRVQGFLDNTKVIVEKQDKIPFLNEKYQKYHQNKKVAFKEYTRLNGDFLKKKENDHMLTDTMVILSDTDSIIYDMNHPEWTDLTLTLLEKSKIIKANADQLKERSFITKELHEYMIRAVDLYSYMYYESKKVVDENSWDNYDIKKIVELTKARGGYDLNVMMQETWDMSDAILAKYDKEYAINNDELYKWGRYYHDEKLAFDPISKILAKFSSNYPKNLPADNGPAIIPDTAEPEGVT